MSEIGNLVEYEKIVLYSIARANNFSLKAHNSEGLIRKFYPKNIQMNSKIVLRKINKAYTTLKTKGLIDKHATGGNMTYKLTKEGPQIAMQLEEILKQKYYK